VAKKFFYVCAGIFMLASAYCLGASTARGQSGSFFECVGVDGEAWAVFGRRLYQMSGAGLDQHRATIIPGTSPVVACGVDRVVLQSGEVYAWDGNASWVLLGTFPGGPTPAKQESFGGIKARYR